MVKPNVRTVTLLTLVILVAGCGPTATSGPVAPSGVAVLPADTPLPPMTAPMPPAATPAPVLTDTPLAPSPSPSSAAHWSVQALTPDYPLQKIEVAGTYEQIGYALGRWYQDRGFLPRPLTAGEQEVARNLLRFYGEVQPSILAQLRGMYVAYGLNLDDVQEAIPVSDNEGVRILLPGLVESGSSSVVFTRPQMAADGHARLGRNYDWPGAAPDTYLLFTQPEGGYATVVMTAHAPGFPPALAGGAF